MTSYKIDELAREAQVSPRTIRYYVQRGLLPAPAFHGRDTTYDRSHLLRLQVIKKLQEGHLPLDEIQARIGAASEKDLERILVSAGVAAGAAAPKGAGSRGGPYRSSAPQDPPTDTDTNTNTNTNTNTKNAGSGALERWDRIHLMPGLELHVRSDAGADAMRAALEIQSQYGQGSSRSS
ncbi:MAG TPA: helix-turn-helix domain-containing protein [Polyangiaceae bacterium]|nr:helix-turn-helix domain-containing protein [Polyangiaceae bacterium]